MNRPIIPGSLDYANGENVNSPYTSRPHDIHYITETKVFTLSGQTDTNCNSALFINTGSTNVSVDGVVIQPGQNFSVDGNRGEILVKTYSFTFASTTANPSLTIVFKRYV